jgi:pyruvate/2-oxoglutarate/acetoin dehydrogenase E1 component
MARLSVLAAIREALQEEMRRDHRVVMIGGDVRQSVSGYTAGLLEEFGDERMIDLPFAEAMIAGVANGAAMAGLRPVVDLGNLGFCLTGIDQIANEGPKAYFATGGQVRAPIVYLFDYSSRGWGPQHDQAIYALLGHLPGMKVVVPSNAADARRLVRAAIRDDNPVAVCVAHGLKALESDVPEADDEEFELGRASTVRIGDDVTVIASGQMVHVALDAALTLQSVGVSVEVVDLRSLVPLDWGLLEAAARKTGRVVVVDHGHYTCGFGPTIAAGVQECAFDALASPVRCVAALDVPVAYNRGLADEVIPTVDRVIAAINDVVAMGA